MLCTVQWERFHEICDRRSNIPYYLSLFKFTTSIMSVPHGIVYFPRLRLDFSRPFSSSLADDCRPNPGNNRSTIDRPSSRWNIARNMLASVQGLIISGSVGTSETVLVDQARLIVSFMRFFNRLLLFSRARHRLTSEYLEYLWKLDSHPESIE